MASDAGLLTEGSHPFSGQVAGFDNEGDALQFDLVSGPSQGQINFNSDGTFTLTPPNNFLGRLEFSFMASDGNLCSNVATVRVDFVHTVAFDGGPNGNGTSWFDAENWTATCCRMRRVWW